MEWNIWKKEAKVVNQINRKSIFLKRIWEDDIKKSIEGDIINYNKDDNMNAPKKILLIKFILIIIYKWQKYPS